MEPELFDKWVAALRSNDFKQTQHHLCNDSGFCCLGVLCEIALLDKSGIPLPKETDGASVAIQYIYEGNGDFYELPEAFRCHIGISSELQEELITLNDEKEYTFAMIANYLENNREKFVKN